MQAPPFTWFNSKHRFCLYFIQEEDISIIKSNIEATNKRRAPNRTVGSYVVLELLGSGAFGSVYKVTYKSNKILKISIY